MDLEKKYSNSLLNPYEINEINNSLYSSTVQAGKNKKIEKFLFFRTKDPNIAHVSEFKARPKKSQGAYQRLGSPSDLFRSMNFSFLETRDLSQVPSSYS